VARRARGGETVEALNGKTYALTPEMTVIADERAVHDIGGIMGGSESGVRRDHRRADRGGLLRAGADRGDGAGAEHRFRCAGAVRARGDPGFVARGWSWRRG
jgi:hypothetical protein